MTDQQMVWPRERQEEMYRRHARKAHRRAIRFMKDHEEEIIAAGEERMLGIGFQQYGDAAFRKSYREVQVDKRDEAADLVVYIVTEIARGW